MNFIQRFFLYKNRDGCYTISILTVNPNRYFVIKVFG